MSMVKFGQLLTAMVTPFTADLEVNLPAAQELAVKLIESGSDGVVVAGTTGESPTLSKKEKIALFKAVVEAIGSKATVIAGTGSYDTAESGELTKEAEHAGVDGFMLVAPYYNKPTQEGLFRHFKTIAQVTSLPVIIYNIPGRTGVNLAPETLVRLTEVPNIAAVKEASGNLAQISQIYEMVPKDFLIYSGDDALTLPVLSVGGVGVISVAGHIAGRKIKEMITVFEQGDLASASRINAELGPLTRALFMTTNPIMVKAACNLIGWKTGGVRLPLVDATSREEEIMREVLSTLGLL
ncbi:MAG TPA: 4-hydroxy-tetrahydrodipicolinate synthase [Bacillota bacterium]|nr:4-hydroxy-tetrahydrodipicolinate synthase [Bacillota bacterium]